MPVPFATERLRRLLAYFENSAASVRATLQLLDQFPTGRLKPSANGNGFHDLPDTVRAAVALDAQRTARKQYRRAKPTNKRTGQHTMKAVIKRRRRTAQLLALFDRTEPRPSGAETRKVVGTFTARGFLARKGAGYIRTAKPFHVDPTAPKE